MDSSCNLKNFASPKKLALEGERMIIGTDTSYILKANDRVIIFKKYTTIPGWRPNVSRFTTYLILRSNSVVNVADQECTMPEIETPEND